jgi:hypothetical protein
MTIVRTTLSAACLLVLLAFPSSAFPLADKPADKWEYAELRHHERAGTRIGPDKVFTSAIEWINGEGIIRGYGWEGMADKLKAPPLKKDALKNAKKEVIEAVQRYRVLNHLGNQGWEMISHERTEKSGITLWTFKRCVGK